MSLSLINFLEIIRLKGEIEAQKHRLQFAVRHPFRVGFESLFPGKLLRLQRGIINRLHARKVAHLCLANPANPILRNPKCFRIIPSRTQKNKVTINFTENRSYIDPNSCSIDAYKLTLNRRHSKLVLVHAFYKEEALFIFKKLKFFSDYDMILTTSDPSIAEEFLTMFEENRVACLILENRGRDILPFLLALQLIDTDKYTHFIKIHTKRSQHLNDGGKWFRQNIETLVGHKLMTDIIFSKIADSEPSIFGIERLSLQDHLENNFEWLSFLLGTSLEEVGGYFIPGTMFAGSGMYLKKLAHRNLHLYQIEPEQGQLDGCFVHALERYFGYLTRIDGGTCGTIEHLACRGGGG